MKETNVTFKIKMNKHKIVTREKKTTQLIFLKFHLGLTKFFFF